MEPRLGPPADRLSRSVSESDETRLPAAPQDHESSWVNRTPNSAVKNWNNEISSAARTTMRQASRLAFIYSQMAGSAKKWNDHLSIISGVLGCIVGTAGLATIAGQNSEEPPLWVRVIQVIAGFLISAVTVLTSTWELNVTQMKCSQAQLLYTMVANQIFAQLSRALADRSDAYLFLDAKLADMEKLRIASPPIDEACIKKYTGKYKNDAVFFPENAWDIMQNDLDEDRQNAQRLQNQKRAQVSTRHRAKSIKNAHAGPVATSLAGLAGGYTPYDRAAHDNIAQTDLSDLLRHLVEAHRNGQKNGGENDQAKADIP